MLGSTIFYHSNESVDNKTQNISYHKFKVEEVIDTVSSNHFLLNYERTNDAEDTSTEKVKKVASSNSNEKTDSQGKNVSVNSTCQFFKKYLPFIAKVNVSNSFLAVLFPLITLLLLGSLLITIPRFIHYQRLREIYYTLSVYDLWTKAKIELEKRYNDELEIRKLQAKH